MSHQVPDVTPSSLRHCCDSNESGHCYHHYLTAQCLQPPKPAAEMVMWKYSIYIIIIIITDHQHHQHPMIYLDRHGKEAEL